MKHFPVSECKYCGSRLFYHKFTFSGKGVEYFNADGSWSENNEGMYDEPKHKLQRTFFCAECDHKLFIVPVEFFS